MFSDLVSFVSTLISSAPSLKSLREKKQAEEAIVNLLTIYLVMTEVLDEGRDLLKAAGANPRKTLRSATPSQVENLRKRFKNGIAIQGHRLYWLSGQLHADKLLKYVDRKTRDRLDRIIGSKFDRVQTLAGTVSALVITTMFTGVETDKEAASLVQSMYADKKGKPLSVKAAEAELNALEAELENLKGACDQLVDKGDLPRLLRRAKKILK